jgi:hypothetical protein
LTLAAEQYISRLEDYLSANQLKMNKIELSDGDFGCRMRFWLLNAMLAAGLHE